MPWAAVPQAARSAPRTSQFQLAASLTSHSLCPFTALILPPNEPYPTHHPHPPTCSPTCFGRSGAAAAAAMSDPADADADELACAELAAGSKEQARRRRVSARSTCRGLDSSTSMPTVSPTTHVCSGCWCAMFARLPPAGVGGGSGAKLTGKTFSCRLLWPCMHAGTKLGRRAAALQGAS
jgi:hypothetical protein